jgi:hypothetical protein
MRGGEQGVNYLDPKREGIPADKVAQDLVDEGIEPNIYQAAWFLIDAGEYHELDFEMKLRREDGEAITE